MDPVVTARVPEGIRSRGVDVLREIGSTKSELVNAAFNYVIQEKEFPRPTSEVRADDGLRKLDSSQMAELRSFMSCVNVPVSGQWESTPFEELLDKAAEARYADFR